MNAKLLGRLGALPPRTLLLAMGGVLLLVALEGWLLGLRQPWTQYAQMRQARAAQVARPLDQAALQAEASRLEAELKRLDARLQDSGAQRPREELVADVAERVARLAATHGVRLGGIRPGPVRRAGGLENMPIDLQLTGRYAALADWLREAERALQPLAVTRFAIQSGDASGALNMEVRLMAHRPADPTEKRK